MLGAEDANTERPLPLAQPLAQPLIYPRTTCLHVFVTSSDPSKEFTNSHIHTHIHIHKFTHLEFQNF